MESRAKARYIRGSHRKLGLVANLIRGKNVGEARDVLNLLHKKSTRIFRSILESAIANAQESKKIDIDTLYVKSVFVNQGPSLKRFHAGPMGRAKPYKKRTSHITMILEEN